MYAIITAGGRQYKIQKDDIIDIDRVKGREGENFSLKEVLAAGDEDGKVQFGSPFIENAEVKAEILRHFRGKKLIAFKIKRRKGYRKTKGHRQELTRVKITGIEIK